VIIGGYTLDLYCDGPRHRELHPNKLGSCDASFAGPTKSDCTKQACEKGWKLTGDKCLCRRCREAARRPTPPSKDQQK